MIVTGRMTTLAIAAASAIVKRIFIGMLLALKTSSSASRYVELEGSLLVKTFAYVGSQADKIGKAEK